MSSFRTQEFRDSNNDNIDDRDQKYGEQPESMYRGAMDLKGIMDGVWGYQPDKDDDEGRNMKNAFGYDMLSKFFDSQMAMGMADQSAGIAKDMIRYTSQAEQMQQSNTRAEEFGYGMQVMDKQYDVQNQMRNQDYARNIGTMQASGEQGRLDLKETGNQARLNRIVDSEQSIKRDAGQGYQTRLNYGAAGYQDRLGMREEGLQNRLQSITDNEQKRLNIGTEGKEQRMIDTNKIRTTGDEERLTKTHNDRIAAGKENRARARAHSLARSA